jgi:hypothetical protein
VKFWAGKDTVSKFAKNVQNRTAEGNDGAILNCRPVPHACVFKQAGFDLLAGPKSVRNPSARFKLRFTIVPEAGAGSCLRGVGTEEG